MDLSTEAEEKLAQLKKKMMVAFMIGDRDGALAEISYQLGITPGELSVAGPWEAPTLNREMAYAILHEILAKFPDLVENILENSGMFRRMQEREERRREQMRYQDRMLSRMDYMPSMPRHMLHPDDQITPAKRDWYIPPYTVKKNER